MRRSDPPSFLGATCAAGAHKVYLRSAAFKFVADNNRKEKHAGPALQRQTAGYLWRQKARHRQSACLTLPVLNCMSFCTTTVDHVSHKISDGGTLLHVLVLAPLAAASDAADNLVQRLLCGCQFTLTDVVQCQLELIGEASSACSLDERL